MGQLLAFPILFILLSLQISLSSKFVLINGFADLILVWLAALVVLTKFKHSWVWLVIAFGFTAYVTALPWYAILIGYSTVMALGVFIKKRIWQSSLLSFFAVLIVGSISCYLVDYLSLFLSGIDIIWADALSRVIIPTILLNLVISFPIYIIVKDLTSWLYPVEENT